jgi:ABC-type antimicrobial peptide transport system permease subunit
MALGAVAGSIGLVSGTLDMGDAVTSRLPFGSAVAGGAALCVVVALPLSVAAADAWRGADRADATAVAAGALLMGWIVVEVAVIRSFSWLQPACFAAGAAIAAAGWKGRRK